MAALLPVITGLASAGSAAVSALTGKSKRSGGRQRRLARRRAARGPTVVVATSKPVPRTRARRKGPRSTAMAGTRQFSGFEGLKYDPVTAMQSTGTVGSSSFSFAGKAQANADVDTRGSLRLAGHGLVNGTASNNLGAPVVTVSTTNNLLTNGAAGSVTKAAIGPNEIDARLAVIASVFGFYAIRDIKLYYVPSVSQFNYGTNSASMAAFGLTDATDYGSSATLAFASISDLPVAAIGPLYKPFCLHYSHKGTRVWNTSTAAEGDIAEGFQLELQATLASPAAASGGVGMWFAEWVVDLYRPMPVESSLSLKQNVPQADFKAPPPLDMKDLKDFKSSYASMVRRRVDDAPSPTQSLLGAELHVTHVTSEPARASSAAMPIPNAKAIGKAR